MALAREIPPEQWDLPTDLEGWTVKDNVAHTAHLEAVLAGAPEETIEVAEAPHLKGLMNYYTEQGVLARRDRDMESLADEIEQAVATRYAALRPTRRPTGPPSPAEDPGRRPLGHRTAAEQPPGRRVDARAGHPAGDRATGRLRLPCRRARDAASSVARCRWWWASASRPPPGTTVRLGGARRRAAPGPSASARTVGASRWTTATTPTTTVTPEPARTSSSSPAAGVRPRRPSRRSRATRTSATACSRSMAVTP